MDNLEKALGLFITIFTVLAIITNLPVLQYDIKGSDISGNKEINLANTPYKPTFSLEPMVWNGGPMVQGVSQYVPDVVIQLEVDASKFKCTHKTEKNDNTPCETPVAVYVPKGTTRTQKFELELLEEQETFDFNAAFHVGLNIVKLSYKCTLSDYKDKYLCELK